jgi:hypothetical protein
MIFSPAAQGAAGKAASVRPCRPLRRILEQPPGQRNLQASLSGGLAKGLTKNWAKLQNETLWMVGLTKHKNITAANAIIFSKIYLITVYAPTIPSGT